MMLKRIRHAIRETGRSLGNHYGSAKRYAKAFDQGMNTLGRFAHAVAPTIDSLAGTSACRQTSPPHNCCHKHAHPTQSTISSTAPTANTYNMLALHPPSYASTHPTDPTMSGQDRPPPRTLPPTPSHLPVQAHCLQPTSIAKNTV